MGKIASAKDESFREYVITASPLKVLFTVCGPLALYQAMQQIFKIMDTLMAAHVSAGAVSAISSLTQITSRGAIVPAHTSCCSLHGVMYLNYRVCS